MAVADLVHSGLLRTTLCHWFHPRQLSPAGAQAHQHQRLAGLCAGRRSAAANSLGVIGRSDRTAALRLHHRHPPAANGRRCVASLPTINQLIMGTIVIIAIVGIVSVVGIVDIDGGDSVLEPI